MKNINTALTFLVLLSLAGCDTSLDGLAGSINQPDIYLAKGMEVQISEHEVASIYGNDKCPDTMTLNVQDDGKGSKSGCIKLTDNKTVNATVVTSDGQFTEIWSVKSGQGLSGTGFSVYRPNGWLLREPGKEE